MHMDNGEDAQRSAVPDIYGMLEHLSSFGTAPPDGCTAFGVGYEDAFERLKRVYLVDGFGRGRSAEKFVIGPFGSGKTHFLRQLMETARAQMCVTAEVALSKDVDFTRTLMVYAEVARQIRAPDGTTTGIRPLLRAALARVRDRAPAGRKAVFTRAWIDGIAVGDYPLPAFGRVVRRALDALDSDADADFEAASRWLEGEVADRALAARLEVSTVQRVDENLHGRRALLSLFRFVRAAGYRGTVVTFDEAEQGLGVDRKKMNRILSMLQSQINAVADLRDGSALIVYALTPNLADEMEGFAALQQRVADPAPGMGFFAGNTRAVRIDLALRSGLSQHLEAIGIRLCDLLYDTYGDQLAVSRDEAYAEIRHVAAIVDENEASSSSRRTMVKATSALLLKLYETDTLDSEIATRIAGAGVA
ncbi:MAG: BREX system ATP-binding domain-containing protein [Thermomicrobiales bacterium]